MSRLSSLLFPLVITTFSLATAAAQSTARLSLTQISVKDYANFTIPECLKKLEAACNKADIDVGDLRIVVEGKISYRGKVRNLYEKVPQELVPAQVLLMHMATKASLAVKYEADQITVRARTKDEEMRAQAQQDVQDLLEGVTLPNLNLVDTKPKAALAYLERAYAKRNPNQKPVKFRISGDAPPSACTLNLQDVPMSEAVRYISGLTDLEFRVQKEKRTIWFKHKAKK